ncbi:hypothetical protein Ciccas_002284 [Cichlidogyrus casuarinus]|uniref:Uncharacterized protein n=1 Tax=Cichlidogyrus casuarinus TaxID=1844966 RepID=A0ABD2QIN7_9PLAT
MGVLENFNFLFEEGEEMQTPVAAPPEVLLEAMHWHLCLTKKLLILHKYLISQLISLQNLHVDSERQKSSRKPTQNMVAAMYGLPGVREFLLYNAIEGQIIVLNEFTRLLGLVARCPWQQALQTSEFLLQTHETPSIFGYMNSCCQQPKLLWSREDFLQTVRKKYRSRLKVPRTVSFTHVINSLINDLTFYSFKTKDLSQEEKNLLKNNLPFSQIALCLTGINTKTSEPCLMLTQVLTFMLTQFILCSEITSTMDGEVRRLISRMNNTLNESCPNSWKLRGSSYHLLSVSTIIQASKLCFNTAKRVQNTVDKFLKEVDKHVDDVRSWLCREGTLKENHLETILSVYGQPLLRENGPLITPLLVGLHYCDSLPLTEKMRYPLFRLSPLFMVLWNTVDWDTHVDNLLTALLCLKNLEREHNGASGDMKQTNERQMFSYLLQILATSTADNKDLSRVHEFVSKCLNA